MFSTTQGGHQNGRWVRCGGRARAGSQDPAMAPWLDRLTDLQAEAAQVWP